MKLLLTIALITIPLAYLWSDTSTTGNLKLLKPSIGTVDPRRSSGDKLNSNFDIIDTSFTNLQNGVLASTTALASNLQGQINFLSGSQSTQDVVVQQLNTAISTNVLPLPLPATYGGTSMSSFTVGEMLYANSTGTLYRVAPNTSGQLMFLSQFGSNNPGWTSIPVSGAYNFYLTSNTIGNYGLMQTIDPYVITSSAIPTLSGADPVCISTWITPVGSPNLVNISTGLWLIHLDASKSSGNKDMYLYAKVYKDDLVNTRTLIFQSQNSQFVTTESTSSPEEIELENYTNSVSLSTGTRIVLEIWAAQSGAGSNASGYIYFQGATAARLTLPSDVISVNNFVPYSGATSEVNLNDKGIIAYSSTFSYSSKANYFIGDGSNLINLSTSIISSRIEQFSNFLSTHSSHQDATLNFLSTAGVNIQQLNLFTSTSDAQQTKFVNFRSTTDLALGSVGGGASLRNYTIYLATGYAIAGSADIFDSYGTTNAINRVGAYGLLGGGNTVQATISVREGVYKVKNATIPAGIDFGGVKGSSTVFVLDSINETMFTVYGRLHDVIIDCSSIAYKGYNIVLKQGGQLDNITYSNCANRAAGWGGFLYITSDFVVGGVAPSTLTARVTNMYIPEYKSQAALTASGDNPSLRVVYAQRVEVRDSYFGSVTAPNGTTEETMSVWRSSNIAFINSVWNDISGRGIIILGQTYNVGFDGCTFHQRRPSYGSAGAGISIFTENAPTNISNSISSRTYVINSTFVNHYGNIGRPYIFVTGTYTSESAFFSNNIFDTTEAGPGAPTDTAISIGAGGLRTLITANRSYNVGTFISDGGTATKYTSLMNFKDGVEQ